MITVRNHRHPPWYEYYFPVICESYKIESQYKSVLECHIVMTFQGLDYVWDPDVPNIRLMHGQFLDHGTVCSGFGAKVMYKYYYPTVSNPDVSANGLITTEQEIFLTNSSQRSTTWCSNRHIPIVHELFKMSTKKPGEREQMLCYNHNAGKITASNSETGEITCISFDSIDKQIGDGNFVVKKFNNSRVYKEAKKALESVKEVVFIGDSAVPQQLILDNFDKCWETIIQGQIFDWWNCFIESLPKTPPLTQLPFDFSVKNNQKLNDAINCVVKVNSLSGSESLDSRSGSLVCVWLSANRIALEDTSGNRLEELQGTGPDYPWITETTHTY